MEGVAVAGLSVSGAEKVAGRAHLANRIQRQFVLAGVERPQELRHHLQQVDIEAASEIEIRLLYNPGHGLEERLLREQFTV